MIQCLQTPFILIMIQVYFVLAMYVLMPVVIIQIFKRWTWAQKIGTVLMAYAVGFILAFSGACSFEMYSPAEQTLSRMQQLLMSVSVSLAIPLMLFNCDFQLWAKSLPKTLWALVGGVLAVVIAVVSGYWVFQFTDIPELDKVAAMLTGIYTGGTMNFNALGSALGVDKSVMAIVLAFQMLITTPYIVFVLAGGYKVYRVVLPYDDGISISESIHRNGKRATEVERYDGMMRKRNFWSMMQALLLSVLFLLIGVGLSIWISGSISEMVVILTITALGIIASFFKPVRQLRKTFELGMFFILVFSVIVASMFDYHSVNAGSMMIGAFVAWIIGVSTLLHLGFCRLGKVGGDLFTVSQVGLLCSPPFVPTVVGAMGNRKVLISGMVIGLMGYAIGTYLGIGIYYLFDLLF